MFLRLFALLLLLLPAVAAAATISLRVDYLPLQEAAELVRTQLSPQGTVAVLASRRLLVVADDEQHLKQARAILKRLDVAPPAYVLHLQILQVRNNARLAGGIRGIRLPAGWLRIEAARSKGAAEQTQSFALRLRDGREGRIELGEIRPIRSEVRRWLGAHGIAEAVMLSPVPITAGLAVRATGLGGKRVRLRLHPWLRYEQSSVAARGKMEVLVDLGSIDAPATPPARNAPVRLNAGPELARGARVIEVMDAATEVEVELGRPLILAAADQAAHGFSQALLSYATAAAARHIRFVLTLQPAP